MSEPMKPISVIPFVGVLVHPEVNFTTISDICKELLGSFAFMSDRLEFDMTDYYSAEMGKGLVRFWVGADYRTTPDVLVPLKWRAYQIEQEHLRPDNTRTLNLDPGYVAPSKVVLATFKDFSHRLYLGRLVYGHLELVFEQGHFKSLPWSYPDYSTQEAIRFMTKLREMITIQKN